MRLCSRSSRCSTSSPSRSFSRVVLLLGERVHLAERLEPALRALELLHEGVAGLLPGLDGLVADSPLQLVGLRAQARKVDVDRGQLRGRLAGGAPHLGLVGCQPAQRLGELTRALAARIRTGAERRFEPGGDRLGGAEGVAEPRHGRVHAAEEHRVDCGQGRACLRERGGRDGGLAARRALARPGGVRAPARSAAISSVSERRRASSSSSTASAVSPA